MNFVSKIGKYHIVQSILVGTTFTMAQGIMKSDASSGCHRLLAVTGDKGKQNDVIVCGSVLSAKQHVIFFGGDVQDYVERMNRTNPLYSPWNIETTAKIILSKFTDSAVFVIKPAKMLLNTFSLYKNFLSFDEEGIPEFTKDFGALSHLRSLYNEAKHKMLEIELNNQVVNTSNDNSDRSCLATGTQEEGSHLATGKQGEDKCLAARSSESDIQEHPVLNSAFPIKLVGFSKGCVVLNQLIHELDHTKDNENLKVFISNISEIYWLDGGHIGGQGAYITEVKKLQDLKNLGCKIVVHVTPYQINDPMRRWIGEEEEKFVNELKELRADITEYRHFMDEIGHIQNHFKVLTLI